MKVLSSEMTDLERADGVNGTAGKSSVRDMVSAHRPPGVLGRVELQSVFTVTREIRQSASIIVKGDNPIMVLSRRNLRT